MNTIILPLPTSVNRTYRSGNGHYFKTDEAREWEKEAHYMFRKYKQKLIKGKLGLDIFFYLKRDRDIDSGLKILLDFLQGRIYENDRQVHQLSVTKFMDKNPRVEIDII